jgi:hypothetical protein
MKKFALLFLAIDVAHIAFSQIAPEIEWQNTIGGDGSDQLFSIHQTPDKGFIVGGISGSNISVDKNEPTEGVYDYWIIKLDSIGNIQWQNTIGGNEYDYLTKVDLTTDGGYIVGGYSDSPASGDKTEDSWPGGYYGYDYWVVKLDSIGNIEWQNTIGGTSDDYLKDLCQDVDGGYILGGSSSSGISGDKTEDVMGEDDYWIVKLDSLGNIVWQNTIGGDMSDNLYDIGNTPGDIHLLGGSSNSGISGDKTEESIEGVFGVNTNDYWIVLVNADSILTQNTIGGNAGDYNLSFRTTNAGKYLLGGQSGSGISGDKTESQIGDDDYWVMLLSGVSEIEWQNTIGTSVGDAFTDLFQNFDGDYLLAGYTDAGISGDKTEESHGGEDFWILKLDTVGNIVWQNSIGGNSSDHLTSIAQTIDGGYILGGYSSSDVSGDKTEESMLGTFDFWIVKLYPDTLCAIVTFYADNDGDGYGSAAFSILSCDTPTAYVPNNLDCDDMNADIHPTALELCNGADDNCNGLIDDDISFHTLYIDIDEDGYGNSSIDTITCLDTLPGYVSNNIDCDDLNNAIYEPLIYYADDDGDLFGDSLNAITVCSLIAPEGYVNNNLDCDDTNPFINPFSNELENGIDDNCNDTIDEGLTAIENINQTLFNIYPNPNNGNFQIVTQNLNSEELTVEVFNLIGEEVYSQTFNANQKLSVNLPHSFSGIANVVIKTTTQTANKLIAVTL